MTHLRVAEMSEESRRLQYAHVPEGAGGMPAVTASSEEEAARIEAEKRRLAGGSYGGATAGDEGPEERPRGPQFQGGTEGAPGNEPGVQPIPAAALSAQQGAAEVGTGNAPPPRTWGALAAQSRQQPSPRGYVSSPGGMLPDTATTQVEREQAPIPKEALQAYARAAQLEGQAAQEGAKAEGAYQQTVGGLVDLKGKLEQDYQKGMQARQQLFEKVVGQHRTQIKKQWEDIKNSKIDPKRYFRDKNAGERVLFALGSLFGGIAAGLKGGENLFLKTAERNIDRDIAAQEADLANKKESARGSMNALDTFMKIHADSELARNSVKTGQMMVVQNSLESLAAQHQGTLAGLKYKQAAAVTAKRVGELIEQQANRVQGKVLQQYKQKYRPPSVVAIGGAVVNKEGRKEARDAYGNIAKKLADKEISTREDVLLHLIKGIGGSESNAKAQELLRGEVGAVRGWLANQMTNDPAAFTRANAALAEWRRSKSGQSLTGMEKTMSDIIPNLGDKRSYIAFVNTNADELTNKYTPIAAEYSPRNTGYSSNLFYEFMYDRGEAAAEMPSLGYPEEK